MSRNKQLEITSVDGCDGSYTDGKDLEGMRTELDRGWVYK